jgi:glycine cleavage system H protein
VSKEDEIRKTAENLKGVTFSRREFLKRAGIVVGGITIASLAFGSACKPSTKTTSESTGAATTTSKDSPTQSTNPTSTSSTSNPPTSTGPSSLPPSSSLTTTPVMTYNYVPPLTLPPLLTVADTGCTVANDGRLYSAEHVWVKSLSTSIAVMGITTTLVEMIAFPNQISLPSVGDVLIHDDTFAHIEGSKLMLDVINPISGTVIQINDFLLSFNKSTEIEPLMNSAYNEGWLVVVQMSKPDELKSLLTAQQYRDLVAKK